MKKLLLIFYFSFLILLLANNTYAQPWPLRVAARGHYLQYENGEPFFWLGDTGWELFHRLKLEEIQQYLDNRAAKGFTVIQAVVLAEMDGLRKGNQYGEVPFIDGDPGKPNEKYFRLVDTVIKMAAARGLYMGLLPTWGDKVHKEQWGLGPVVFDSLTAYKYGQWLGRRYAKVPNIIWILGGDRVPFTEKEDFRPVWRAMAKGLREGDARKLIAYHPSGGKSSAQMIHNEKWLDINMFQSGHGNGHDVPVWEWLARDRAMKPLKPVLDGEPNYEDHPVNPWPKWDSLGSGFFRDDDVRKQCYRSVFAGATGVTYGHHAVWQFYNPREQVINHADRFWTDAIDRPGAFQVGYLRRLMESRPMLGRVPDQSLVVGGQGEKGFYITAFRDSANSYAMIYIPVGMNIAVNTSFIKNKTVNVWWFNPRNGEVKKIGAKDRVQVMSFTPPELGVEKDWVLVLDDVGAGYVGLAGK